MADEIIKIYEQRCAMWKKTASGLAFVVVIQSVAIILIGLSLKH